MEYWYLLYSWDFFSDPGWINTPVIDTMGTPNVRLTTECFETVVFIPDTSFFTELLEQGIDKNGDGLISYEEASEVHMIDVTNMNVFDLTGIEAFTSLDTLLCGYNHIRILDLAWNEELKYLNCQNNQLTHLYISRNESLRYLDCQGNDLLSLTPNDSSDLVYINCSDNKLVYLDVTVCSALRTLLCYNNQLSSLDVTNNDSLEVLLCAFDQLKELDVSNNTSFTYLSCCFNELEELDVGNNELLVRLWCSNNQLSSLDVTQNTNLAALVCSNNNLSSLDISNNTSLVVLDCKNNNLTALDLEHNTLLGHLDCSANQIERLDISNNPGLMIHAYPDYSYGFNLILSRMPSLTEVCVWEMPFPPDDRKAKLSISGSSNVVFEDCANPDTSANSISQLNSGGIHIYPNPNEGVFRVEIENPGIAVMEIYNLQGSQILRKEVQSANISVDISTLPKGMYLIRINAGNGVKVGKVVCK
ncbi:T9SS type A sorting domain-containing protein [Bacteroidota bacterium]